MMQQEEPRDYVIASETARSVREFVETAFGVIDVELSWEGSGLEETGVDKARGKVVVEVDPAYHRPADIDVLCGDASRVAAELGWKPRTSFEELVELMVEKDLERLKLAR